MKIQVTTWHIESGLKGDCCLCPIALALRENPNCMYPRVGGFNLYTTDYDTHFESLAARHPDTIGLGTAERRFINEFDHGFAVEPFKIHISAEAYINIK